MNQKIEYLREKTHKISKIIWDNKTQKWVCKLKTIVKSFDHILNRWDVTSSKEELMPLQFYPNNPDYQKELFILIKRIATDSTTLKLLVRFYKQKLTVKSTDSNIVLCIVNGSIFQTNLLNGSTQPISLNGLLGRYRELFPHIQVSTQEPTPVSNAELVELINKNYPIIEQQMLPDGSEGEYKSMI